MSSQLDKHLGLTPSPADDVDVLAMFDVVVMWRRSSRFTGNGSVASGDSVATWFSDRLSVWPTCVVPRRHSHVQKLKTTGTIFSSIRNLPIVMNLGSTMVYGYPYRDEGGRF